jgi:hypothetical protein
MQCHKKLKPSRETAALQSEGIGTGTCFAGEREGERDGMGWVRLLGELDPDPGSESVPTNKKVMESAESYSSNFTTFSNYPKSLKTRKLIRALT